MKPSHKALYILAMAATSLRQTRRRWPHLSFAMLNFLLLFCVDVVLFLQARSILCCAGYDYIISVCRVYSHSPTVYLCVTVVSLHTAVIVWVDCWAVNLGMWPAAVVSSVKMRSDVT